jgi:hypothetical protein
MSKPKAVTLKITNCLDCPHHKKVTSTYTGDSFDMADIDVVCTLANGSHQSRDGITKGRAVLVSERWRVREQCVVPTWCPLTAKKRPIRKHPCDKG